LLAGAVGIIIGALFYPKPDLLSPWALTAPLGGQMFWAFASALVISSVISAVVVLGLVAPDNEYDFAILNADVQLIDDPAPADD
jgi:hypothetical protein